MTPQKNANTNKYEIYCTSQGVHSLRDRISDVLDIDPSANWEELLSSKLKIKPDLDENEFSDDDDNELKRFTLGN